MEMRPQFHQNWFFSCANTLVSFCLARTFQGNLPNLYKLLSCSFSRAEKIQFHMEKVQVLMARVIDLFCKVF